MTSPAYNEALKALEKAKDAVQNAAYDLKGGFVLATANRAYYACYYCMTALLYTENVYAKTHQGIRAKFSEHFIKPGVFPVTTSEIISLLFDYRQEADYDLDADITPEEASDLVEKAREFLQLTRQYFEKQNKQ
jgi:uncharacterized protein (UPF0332 family)